ncbi:MAG: CARDB domain-containing protein [Terriglobia bacterium]
MKPVKSVARKLAIQNVLKHTQWVKRPMPSSSNVMRKNQALSGGQKNLVGLPNLLPYQPGGWSGPIVVSTVEDTNLDATSLTASNPLYIDFAIGNDGDAVAGPFVIDLYIDEDKISLPYDDNLEAGYLIGALDLPIGMLPTGVHMIKIVADATGAVKESDEADNEYTKAISVMGPNMPNLTIFRPLGWSDPIVVSNARGNHIDSSPFTANDTLYADFAYGNDGTAPTGPFKLKVLIDGVAVDEWQENEPLERRYYRTLEDYPIGTLSVGTHTIQLVVDTDNSLNESNEDDNQYSKIIDVIQATETTTSIFVPVVISTAGLNGSFFTTELILTNKGERTATLEYSYLASFGGGSGSGHDTLNAGQQKIVPDAINYLRSLGVPIPSSGNLGGTLTATFSGIATASDVAITVRTTTAVEGGRAGLAYPGIPLSNALTEVVYLCGLRQTETDRSNVAIQNIGPSSEGNIVLKLTVFSGDPQNPFSKELPLETLSPGGFKQISGILISNGLTLTNGYVRVERVSGAASYYAYAVINDQINSDGSYIFPLRESDLIGCNRLTLPVLVEANAFSSELIITNWSQAKKTLHFEFVSDAIQTGDHRADFTVEIKSSEQISIPEFIDSLRQSHTPGIGDKGPAFAGALFVEVSEGDLSGVAVSARTSSPGGGGRFGLFYGSIPKGHTTDESSWIYGLQQNAENRSNLALVNTGDNDNSADTFKIEIFDGDTGALAHTIEGTVLSARSWKQFGSILSQFTSNTTQGYVKVTKVGGTNPFVLYGVVNDGEKPEQRTGDGAYIANSP